MRSQKSSKIYFKPPTNIGRATRSQFQHNGKGLKASDLIDETVYTASSEDEEQWGTKLEKWSQSKLQLAYKPEHIVGREQQRKIISQFIDGCVLKQITNRCLYISGCPGIGKTLIVKQIIQNIGKDIDQKKVQFIYINALSIKQPHMIYKQLLLSSKKSIQSKKQAVLLAMQFDSFIKTTKIQFVFIIDEVDFLYTKNQNIMYNLVEWCSLPIYKFSVIMIANTMDFPQRLSPKIKSRMGTWRITFKPYTSTQIKQILEQRLTGSDMFEQKALTFITKKFSVYTSDLRKIFNIIKQVINSKKGPKVKIQDVTKIWSQLVEQQDLEWQQVIPEIYNKVLDMIKREGGKMHSYQIYKILYQQQKSYQQVQLILEDMRQMGFVKLVRKHFNGCAGLMATLI